MRSHETWEAVADPAHLSGGEMTYMYTSLTKLFSAAKPWQASGIPGKSKIPSQCSSTLPHVFIIPFHPNSLVS